MPYGNVHKYILRTIASQSVISLEDTKELLEKQSGNEQLNIREIIQEINKKIKPLKQMIKIVSDEVTSKELVVFLSLGYDDTTKAQNVFAPAELEFFRLLMEQIINTDTREISDINAINLVNNIKVNRLLSTVDAQRLLNVWCRMRYLEHEDENYALGVRAIHEFDSYFSTNMPDSVKMKCYICTAIVFRGYNCPHCPESIHNRCLEASLKNAQKWPCCKTMYDHSQLQELRAQSFRSSRSSRLEVTQSMEATQTIEATQTMEATQRLNENSLEDSLEDEEMGTANDTVFRARKRRRLDS